MKFKLDENFGTRTQRLFHAAGHDVQNVREQKLQGCADKHLYQVCRTEKRCLVTLDLDFANVTRFPPSKSYGIAIIRLPRNPSLVLLEQLVSQLLQAVVQMPIAHNLWIVEPSRIRVHQSETEG